MSGTSDPINPDYYKAGGIETAYWMYWAGFTDNYYICAAVKYLARVGKKTPDGRQDLGKAIRYLEFALELTPEYRVQRRCHVGSPGTIYCGVQDFCNAKDLTAGVSAALKEIEAGYYRSAIGFVRAELKRLEG